MIRPVFFDICRAMLKKALHIIMALLVFVSSSGFTYVQHHCHSSDQVMIHLSDVDDLHHAGHSYCLIHEPKSIGANQLVLRPAACCSHIDGYFKSNIPADDLKVKRLQAPADQILVFICEILEKPQSVLLKKATDLSNPPPGGYYSSACFTSSFLL